MITNQLERGILSPRQGLFFFGRVKNIPFYEEVIRLSKNPYWNTIWSNRDQEFYWSGVKGGALISGIMVLSIVAIIQDAIREFKESSK